MFSCFDAEIAALKEEEGRLYAAQLENLTEQEKAHNALRVTDEMTANVESSHTGI